MCKVLYLSILPLPRPQESLPVTHLLSSSMAMPSSAHRGSCSEKTRRKKYLVSGHYP